MRKPARLNALTGLRCFAAINIVFFHFSNPQWFGLLAPVVNAGYASVSFFILLSGFVMAYNYADKARDGELNNLRFWEARFTRLYPIYLLSLLLAWQVVPLEYAAHTHAHVLDRHGAYRRCCCRDGFPQIATFSEYAGVDHVGRVVLLPAVSVDGEVETARRGLGPHLGKMVWRLDAGAGARHALHCLQSRWNCASRPLELGPVAAGAQIYAAAASGELHVSAYCWHRWTKSLAGPSRLRLMLGVVRVCRNVHACSISGVARALCRSFTTAC